MRQTGSLSIQHISLQMLPLYSYKNNYCIQTIHAPTKCLKFARVKVIQETQKSPFHFLDIWYICEKRMLDWCCLCPFCFASWRFGFLFYYTEQKNKPKRLLPAFTLTENLKCKISVHLGFENEMEKYIIHFNYFF